MTMSIANAQKWAALLTAYGLGKTIEVKDFMSGNWVATPRWHFDGDDPDNYRIKPEPKVPRVLYVEVYNDGSMNYCDRPQECAEIGTNGYEPVETRVKFVEVIEDENT